MKIVTTLCHSPQEMQVREKGVVSLALLILIIDPDKTSDYLFFKNPGKNRDFFLNRQMIVG